MVRLRPYSSGHPLFMYVKSAAISGDAFQGIFDSLINANILTRIDTTFPRHISRQKHDIKHDM